MWHTVCVSDTDTKTPRVHVTFRISASGLGQLDNIAEAEGRARGDVIRRLLAEGIRNWNRKTGASA